MAETESSPSTVTTFLWQEDAVTLLEVGQVNFSEIMPFIDNKLTQFKTWWRKPATPADRFFSVLLGAWAGLWIGVIGRLFVGEMPVGLGELFRVAVITAAVLGFCGAVFPKTVSCIAFPFAFLGVSGGS